MLVMGASLGSMTNPGTVWGTVQIGHFAGTH